MSAAARVRFTLFVTGTSPRTDLAIANLRRLCDDLLEAECDVEIIDALERPDLAEQQRILATPTLIKVFPEPRRRVTGDLSDTAKVLQILRLGPMGWEGVSQ